MTQQAKTEGFFGAKNKEEKQNSSETKDLGSKEERAGEGEAKASETAEEKERRVRALKEEYDKALKELNEKKEAEKPKVEMGDAVIFRRTNHEACPAIVSSMKVEKDKFGELYRTATLFVFSPSFPDKTPTHKNVKEGPGVGQWIAK